jgi:hypothetical protein
VGSDVGGLVVSFVELPLRFVGFMGGAVGHALYFLVLLFGGAVDYGCVFFLGL